MVVRENSLYAEDAVDAADESDESDDPGLRLSNFSVDADFIDFMPARATQFRQRFILRD